MKKQNFVNIDAENTVNYVKPSTAELNKLFSAAQKQEDEAKQILQISKQQYYFSLIRDIVEKYYDIGELYEIYQLFGGYINTTFGIYTIKDGQRQTWLLRIYKEHKRENALKFEHSLLRHAKSHGFIYGSAPINNKNGASYCRQVVQIGGCEKEVFFAVFEYMDGDNLYDWIINWSGPDLKEITIKTGAQSLAMFHSSTNDFDSKGLFGDNITNTESSQDVSINDLTYAYPETLKSYIKIYKDAGLDSPFTKLVNTTYDLYYRMCKKNHIPYEDCKKIQYNPCHCDGHSGNFKYGADGRVLCSFDYDMSKFDYRILDLGLSLHYLYSSWDFVSNGALIMDRIERHIKYYDDEIRKQGKIPALTKLEKKYLYEAIVQGTVYDNSWCTAAVMLDPALNQYEYFYYALHSAKCLEWLEKNEEEIRAFSEKL